MCMCTRMFMPKPVSFQAQVTCCFQFKFVSDVASLAGQSYSPIFTEIIGGIYSISSGRWTSHLRNVKHLQTLVLPVYSGWQRSEQHSKKTILLITFTVQVPVHGQFSLLDVSVLFPCFLPQIFASKQVSLGYRQLANFSKHQLALAKWLTT